MTPVRVKNYHGGVPTADMRLRNRDGSPVDPVPFLVLAAMAFAVAYSFGPIYFDALGVSLVPALALSTAEGVRDGEGHGREDEERHRVDGRPVAVPEAHIGRWDATVVVLDTPRRRTAANFDILLRLKAEESRPHLGY